MITTQTKQGYTKQNNTNQIINVIPAGIKCKTCNLFFAPDQLQKHFATHIDPRYLISSPAVNSYAPRKINLSALLQDPEKSSDDIFVMSMMADDLPRAQVQRKKVGGPSGHYAPLLNQIYKQQNVCTPDSNKQAWSTTSETNEQAERQQDQLNIKKGVKLNRARNQIEKKQLHVYTNQNTGTANIDLVRSKRRQQNDTETQPSQKQLQSYNILQAPQQPPQQKKLLSQSKKVTYHISSDRKQPAHPLQISTMSRMIQADKMSARSRSTLQENQDQFDHDRKLQCPCCKGFYCDYCKSTIPPIYRPVPDSQGNYHFRPMQDQRSKQFYNMFYQRQASRLCGQCERSSPTHNHQVNNLLQVSGVNNYALQNSRNKFQTPGSTRIR